MEEVKAKTRPKKQAAKKRKGSKPIIKTRHSRVAGYPGAGLFENKLHGTAGAQALRVTSQFIADESIEVSTLGDTDAQSTLTLKLDTIARNYLSRKDYEAGATFGEMRPFARRLKKRIESYIAFLSELPAPLRLDLFHQSSGMAKDFSETRDLLTTVELTNDMLRTACIVILKRRMPKAENLAVRNACAALWCLREEIVGRPFKKTWKTAPGRDGQQFTSRDAHFVHSVLKAMDAQVTIAEVETALRALAKDR